MTDRKRLSRRDSLKRIAAAGTVFGGATLGLSTAMAHDETDDGKEDEKYENESNESYGKDDKDGKKDDHGKKDDKNDDGNDEKEDDGKDGKHDDGKHDKNDDGKDGKDSSKRIDLAPVCYETDEKKGDEKYGKFCVENHGKQDVKVGWERHCDGKRDYVSVGAGKKEYFRVGLGNSGTATVSLYYDGKKIATADANTKTRCDR